MGKYVRDKSVILSSTLERIENIYALPKIGAGSDGIVFKYNELALKILKYDFLKRKERDLMTFEKALLFSSISGNLKRLVLPTSVLLEHEGIFCGYAMEYIEETGAEVGSYSLDLLLKSFHELSEDFSILSKNGIIARDMNEGSYLFSEDFLHLCDSDKFKVKTDAKGKPFINNKNRESLNFVIAKLLYWEMIKMNNIRIDDDNRKILLNWVKRVAHTPGFLSSFERDINGSINEPISEYVKSLSNRLLK